MRRALVFLLTTCPTVWAQIETVVPSVPRLPLLRTELAVQAPRPGWALGMVTSVASDPSGLIYILQRGHQADPVVVVDRQGRVVRSWGAGLFQLPHGIRLDPAGNVWTVDCETSIVRKFTRAGRQLLEIHVGGQPKMEKTRFVGATDVAFAPNGHVFVADGYQNARILEYTAAGQKVREWGSHGTGPGQFHLPHGIAIDAAGIVYVADRENGRIQRFDLAGRHLGTWPSLGKAFSLKLHQGALWLGTQPLDQPNGSPGWLMELDLRSGQPRGLVESTGHHSLEVTAGGELLTGTQPNRVLYFRPSSAAR